MIVLLVARAYTKFRENQYVEGAFSVLRPVVVGLIAAAALLLVNKDNFIDYKSVIIFAVAFILTKSFRIHPILMIILAGISGLFLY
jgi:chromate transporter